MEQGDEQGGEWWMEPGVIPVRYVGREGYEVDLWVGRETFTDRSWNWGLPTRALFESKGVAETDDPYASDGSTSWGLVVANGAIIQEGIVLGFIENGRLVRREVDALAGR